MNNILPLLLVSLLLFSPFIYAEGDAPPVNINEILKALDTIQKQAEETRLNSYSNTIQMLSKASANPNAAMELYEKAIGATQFQGQTRENSKLQDWKRKESDKLRDKNFQTSVQMHLRYLALTLRYSAGEKSETLVPDLLNYTADVLALRDGEKLDPEMMSSRAPVNKGMFIEGLQLQGRITDSKEWEMNPADVDGMFGKYILPVFRKDKDPRVIAYWDRRINRAESASSISKKNLDLTGFNNVEKPKLLWSRAHEYLALDQKNRAIQEMFAVIKTYPAHPDVMGWVEELKQALIEKKP